jgi:hypothetical protein
MELANLACAVADFSNPHLSAAATAAANAAASARAATYESAPRIALLCIDNVAAFHQLVKGQPPGSTGIGSGAHTPERIAVTTGLSDAHGAAASSSANDRNRTWLYELFARQLKATMQTRQLMCIATKPPLTRKAVSLQRKQHSKTNGRDTLLVCAVVHAHLSFAPLLCVPICRPRASKLISNTRNSSTFIGIDLWCCASSCANKSK